MANNATSGAARVLKVEAVTELHALLAEHACSPTPLVLRLTTEDVPLSDVAAALCVWAERSAYRSAYVCGVALVFPKAEVDMARCLAWDLAEEGAVVGVFSERDLPFAVEHALREIDVAAGQAVWEATRDTRFQKMLSTIVSDTGRAA